jgi:hypothetical protein
MLCPKNFTTTYEEEGKVKICKRCPGEHELHGVVNKFQLRKRNFKVSIVIHTRHETEIEQIRYIHTWRKILRKKFWPDVQILKKYTVAWMEAKREPFSQRRRWDMNSGTWIKTSM